MASSGEEKDDGQDDTVVYDSEIVLDLCGRRLKRLEKAPANQAYATALVLDNNSLQNLANLDSYGELERLSIANNQIVRMYWFARMYSLRVLNLPNNNIVQVEGMRELIHLVHLNLAGNKLKTIEGLSYNRTLEHLNLSGNFISHVNDLSMLKNLKELFLHRNLITTLYRCNKYLPPSLIILTLSDNGLNDLNDLSNLSHLNHLEQVTILNNPCLDPIQPTDESGVPFGPPLAFDYRPYVINWCLNLKVLDGYKVTPKESLKAEWLYSQGKGRGFQVGEHAALVQYLSGVCLAGGGWGGADLPDDDDKLAKILQLAKQHQHDLRHSVNGQDVSESSSGRGSRSSSHHDSPAMHRRSVVRSTSVRRNTAPSRSAPARECHRRTHSHSAVTRNESGSRSQQANSYHVELSNTLYGGDLRTPDTPSLMTQSMDPAILSQLAGTAPRGSTDLMSRSLGAEQLSRSLGVDPMTQSMGEEELKYSMEFDPMTQSQGPEQLARSLAHQDSSNSLMTRSLDLGHLTNGEAEAWGEHVSHPLPHSHPRPTSLFGDENDLVVEDVEHQDHSSQLTGSSKFVPAPESIMSPEFQAAVATHTTHIHSSSGAPTQQSANVARSSSLSRSQRPPPSIRSTSASQGSPRQPTSRSSSVTRPRASPLKSPVPTDIARGSPSRTARPATTLQNTNTGPSTLPRPKPSPKPAPRYVRSVSVEPTTRHLTEKLRSTEEALERERRLRHMQLDAIRTLWREIQKLQASKRDGVNTPSTPITPLTPLTPLDSKEGAASAPAGTKKYSEESVKELTEFCASLQGQVGQLQESLSMVTQVMNAFCNLPGSQSLLTMSQSSGSGHERSPGGGDSPPSQSVASIPVPLSESVTSLTHSIRALTTSIVKSPSNHNDNTICVEGIVGVGGSNVNNSGKIHCDDDSCGDPSSDGSDGTPVACQKQPPHLDQFINPEMINSMTSVASTDLNATALDASTLSVDSTEGGEADTTGRDEAELSESSQSSLSGSLSGSHSGNQSEGGRQAASQGPQRPSSLPVPRPHTPRTTTS
nr:mucin-5AC-like isoform X3 [Cherax quadricarinatus]